MNNLTVHKKRIILLIKDKFVVSLTIPSFHLFMWDTFKKLGAGSQLVAYSFSTHAYFSIFKSLNALIAAVLKALLG
jgi:hypothetical protein